MSSPVEDFSDRAERFLACCIPDLQLEETFLDFNAAGSEIDSHCHIMLGVKLVLRQPSQDTRLSDTGVAKNDDLEQFFVGYVLV